MQAGYAKPVALDLPRKDRGYDLRPCPRRSGGNTRLSSRHHIVVGDVSAIRGVSAGHAARSSEGGVNTPMPTKRAVLAELTAEELRANVDYYELDVADRRVKAQLVDALAGSRRARADEILGGLSRDRLKELCRALGQDDSGRSKADLVARLMVPAGATRSAAQAASPPTPSRPAAAPSSPTEEALSVAQLEQFLWSAADILRGSIDSSDYKTYIFGLLFLKRLSDRFEEEAQKRIADGMSETVAWTDPDEHQFFVPDRARWGTIQRTATNIGETLNKACASLEEENAKLEGVLAGIDYNDERKLGDARNRDTVLARPRPSISPKSSLRKRPHGRARPARPRLRVPDRAVRRRRGQEGRRVLHTADGRQAHRRAAGADRTACASAIRPPGPAAC